MSKKISNVEKIRSALKRRELLPAAFAAGKHQNCLCVRLKSVVFFKSICLLYHSGPNFKMDALLFYSPALI